MKLDKILNPEVEIVSFDLFDTLVDRRGYGIHDILDVVTSFALKNWRWAKGVSVEELRHSRFHTSNLVHSSGQITEMHAAEVWKQIVYCKCIEPSNSWNSIVDEIVKLELSLDRELLTVKDHTFDTIAAVKKAGKKVIIFSDMYFSKSDLLTIPIVKKIHDSVDAMYVSQDLQVKKSDGSAYQFLIKELNTPPAKIIHIGDNENSDVIMAKKNGFQAKFYYEKKPFQRPAYAPKNKLDSITTGLSAASTKLAFRIIEWCKRNDCHTIGLIARDGTLFRPFIEKASQILKFEVNFSDIQVDRFTLELASFNSNKTDLHHIQKWIGENQNRKERLQVLTQENGLKDFIPHLENNSLNDELIIPFLSLLDEVRSSTLEHLNSNTSPIAQTAFVDIGYGGSAMRLISNLFTKSSAFYDHRVAFFSLIQNSHFGNNKSLAQPNLVHEECVLNWSKLNMREMTNFAMIEPWFKNRNEGPVVFTRDEKKLCLSRATALPPQNAKNILDHNASFNSSYGLWETYLIAYKPSEFHKIEDSLYQALNHPDKAVTEYYHQHLPSECPETGKPRSVIFPSSHGKIPPLKQLHDADYWLEGSLVYNSETMFPLNEIKHYFNAENNPDIKTIYSDTGIAIKTIPIKPEKVTLKRKVARLRRKALNYVKNSPNL